MDQQQQYKYRAFISYSHADEEWAKWLHKALETYRMPKRLVGRETEFGAVPDRIAPVFRDRDELATATNLGDILTRALEESACQLVICSRKSAKSRWVNEEIKTFKRLGKAHRIFALIVDGEPGASAKPETADQECFPPALIYKMGANGELTDEPTEPIAADVRPGQGQQARRQAEDRRRHVRRRARRAQAARGAPSPAQLMMLVPASVAGMAITSTLAGAAWLARNEAERQRVRAEAEAETARQTTRFMVDLFKVSDPSEALGNTITAREILDKGAQRIDSELADQPAIQATLMDTMGTVYTSLGLYDAGDAAGAQSVPEATGAVGARYMPEVASSLNHLGEVLTLQVRLRRGRAAAAGGTRDPQAVVRATSSAEVAETLTRWPRCWSEGRVHRGRAVDPRGARHPAEAARPRSRTRTSRAASRTSASTITTRGEYEKAVRTLREAVAMQQEAASRHAAPGATRRRWTTSRMR